MKTRPTLARLLYALTLLASSALPAWADDELGRLFFTPERRQILDRQREYNIQETQVAPEDPTLTINGVVTRSSGKQTTWINGVAQSESDTPSNVSVKSSPRAPGKILVQSNEQPAAQANVGDTINRNTGETTDLLGDGQISIRPGRPAKPPAK